MLWLETTFISIIQYIPFLLPGEVAHQLDDTRPVFVICGEANASVALESVVHFKDIKVISHNLHSNTVM